MSLREEAARYEKLTGEIAEHTPIIQIGAFLDGVDKGIEELNKIKEEMENKSYMRIISGFGIDKKHRAIDMEDVCRIIDNHISELKGETE